MISARTNTLAALRGRIERLRRRAIRMRSIGSRSAMSARMRCCAAGLARGAVHEVFAEGRQSGAATGLVAGFAGRLSPRRPLVWVRQDFSRD